MNGARDRAGRYMAALAAAELGEQRDRIALTLTWGEVERVRPMLCSANRFVDRLFRRERFIVQYKGNMGRTHGVEMVGHAEQVLHGNFETHFLSVGWGGRKDRVERAVEHARDNRRELPAMGERSRAAAERSYAKDLAPAQYYGLLRELEVADS